ncbi:methyltransferase [Planomonospora parontospora subsp. parontospora]|uniref:Methyltransferase n=2 Tax=Planomonospora parontospora TaxID=58119 RepID=A0AA37BDQ5_9ACTN|nr:class I SAM-dependent methyltransferase [Planomonospora parontospora]GGK55490.1 methyltransferase [Planomonospora parontospora]GII07383.1 methyltransferase [Planomonospora parontospora subsp. parontospora]
MDLDAFRELLTPRGQEALEAAAELAGDDPVAAVTRLRKTYDADLTSAALGQAVLRRRAREKFGADADLMYFTPHGLEQATRREVADHRARRIPAGSRVADVCCGIGGDLLALARAGCTVEAVDADPLTAAVARANADALGFGDRVTVRAAGADTVDPAAFDVLFADPARRTARGRTFDPLAYSPAWPEVLRMVAAARAACLKVAPGIPYEFIPAGAEAEWVSHRGEVKEAVIWAGALAGGVERRATMLPSGLTMTPGAGLGPAEVGPIGRYVYEPDGAAIRSHLVAEVAALVGGRLIDPHIAYITSDVLADTPWASRYEVHEVLPFSLKRLRAALRERGVGNVTIKKRGSAVDVERLRKDLRLSGKKFTTVILTRVIDRPFVLVCDPC